MSALIDATHLCNCEDDERAACEAPLDDFKGKLYCLFHLPSEDKDRDGAFRTAIQKRLEKKNYSFRGVWFPVNFACKHTFDEDADFSKAVFNAEVDFSGSSFKKKVHFSNAEFRNHADFVNTNFNETDFSSAEFKDKAKASFPYAHFGSANFESTIFGKDGGTNFNNVIFEDRVSFAYAQFCFAVVFDKTIFKKDAIFQNTSFYDKVSFAGTGQNQVFDSQHMVDFGAYNIHFPDRVSFSFLTLRPHWFVRVDPREFQFTKVNWWPTGVWWRGNIQREIESLKAVEFPHDLLVTVCHRLAANYEANNSFEEASRFRYMAMAVRQRETAHGPAFWKLSWWYGLASGYGERTLQAAFVLAILWFLFALIFFLGQNGGWWKSSPTPAQGTTITTEIDDSSPPLGPGTRTFSIAITSGVRTSPLLSFRDALIYSAGVMTLQKPEPQPASKWAKSFVLLETIFGPVQAALLALAIRRKFMR